LSDPKGCVSPRAQSLSEAERAFTELFSWSLSTAKELGQAVPLIMQTTADEVIE